MLTADYHRPPRGRNLRESELAHNGKKRWMYLGKHMISLDMNIISLILAMISYECYR